MAGKFTDVSYNDAMTGITGATESAIRHQFYKYTEATDTICTYYSLNEASGLDDGTKTTEDYIGQYTALKYDIIKDFHLLGLNIATINMDIKEYGLESGDVSGNCAVIPNTIIPKVGDFFKIDCLKQPYLFRITDVQVDTLENGTNSYQCDYTLFSINKDTYGAIDKYNIMDEYICIFNNIGTDLDCIVLKSDYNFLEYMDGMLTKVRNMFIESFYNYRIQNFTFLTFDGTKPVYDPCVVEFIMNTGILITGSSDDIYIQHLISVSPKFNTIFNRSIFTALIEKDIKKLSKCPITVPIVDINQMIGIFASRPETYFTPSPSAYISDNSNIQHIEIMDADLVSHITNNEKYETITNNTNDFLKNIIIKYFNNERLTKDDLYDLEWIDIEENSSATFYYLVCVLYCITMECEKLLHMSK